jgi:hypothetical protein
MAKGVSLGDTITASNLIAKGELIVPFDLTVPANDAFTSRAVMRCAMRPLSKSSLTGSLLRWSPIRSPNHRRRRAGLSGGAMAKSARPSD